MQPIAKIQPQIQIPQPLEEALNHLNYRITSLATYYFSMMFSGMLNENMLPKAGAPYFSGHPVASKNVFDLDVNKFFENITSQLGFFRRNILKLVLPLIQSQVSRGVAELSSKILQDALYHTHALTQDPLKTNIRLLEKIHDLLAEMLPKYKQAHLNPSAEKKPSFLEEKMVIAERVIFDLDYPHWCNPHLYLQKACHDLGIELDVLKSTTIKILEKEGFEITNPDYLSSESASDSEGERSEQEYQKKMISPRSWEDLFQALDGYNRKGHLISEIENALLQDALEQTINNRTHPSKNQQKAKEALRHDIWERQIEIAKNFMPSPSCFARDYERQLQAYATYQSSIYDTIIKYHAQTMAFKKYGYRNLQDAQKRIEHSKLAHSGVTTRDELIASYQQIDHWKRLIEEFDNGVKKELDDFKKTIDANAKAIEGKLRTQSSFDLLTGFYQEFLSSIIQTYLVPGHLQLIVRPEQKASEILNSWTLHAPDFNIAKRIAYFVIGACLASIGYLYAMVFGRMYNALANYLIVSYATHYIAKVASAIFSGLTESLIKKDGFKGDLFTILNRPVQGEATTNNDDFLPEIKEGPLRSPSEREIAKAKDVISLLLQSSDKIHITKSQFLWLNFAAKKVAALSLSQVANNGAIHRIIKNAIQSTCPIFENWNAPSLESALSRTKGRKAEKWFYSAMPITGWKIVDAPLRLFAKGAAQDIVSPLTHPQTLIGIAHRLIIAATNHLNHERNDQS